MSETRNTGVIETARAHAVRSAVPVWLALVFAGVCGALVAVQSRVNGELGDRLGDGFAAAAISFGSGLAILFATLALWRPGRVGLRRVVVAVRERRLSWWMLLGGCAGAFLVLSQGLTAVALGVALFTVAIVAGQTISGLVLDLTGIAPGGKRRLTVPRVIGAVLALGAVGWAVSAQLPGGVPFWMLVTPFLAGLGIGWQQAVNGRVKAVAGSAMSATLVNFLSGTIVLVVATLVHSMVVGWPDRLPSEPWLYVGGAIGCVFIAGAALLVRITGVLLLGLATIAGQLIAALALDLLVPSVSHPVGFSTVAGTMLTLVAVIVASVPWRRPGVNATSSGKHSV
ncbi:DMT family transporter [Luethyella okanaganae]|uniref:DMT family transporter n=1 Tax=Luethyella okanaganae TaxID=69372 RepID=A0ABW1VKC4_9MICO